MTIIIREKSLYLQSLEALYRRTPPNHPKLAAIKESLRKNLAGYRGECAVDYQLSYLSEKNYSICRGIRLYVDNHFFQIDTLLLSQKSLLIIESKNLAGEVTIDEKNHQLIQEVDGVKKAYQDPLLQIYFHELNLKKWLLQFGFPEIPIQSLVALSNPHTILRSTSHKVIRTDYLPIKIKQLEKNHQDNQLTEKLVKKLFRLVKKYDTPLRSNLLEKFEMTYDELLKGVQCPKCDFLPLTRSYGSWNCPRCHRKDPFAHLSSIKDYSLIVNPSFKNEEIRNFLNITNRQLVKRLLKAQQIASEGQTKSKIYKILN